MGSRGIVKWASYAEPMRLDRIRQAAVAGGINARSQAEAGEGVNRRGRQSRGVSPLHFSPLRPVANLSQIFSAKENRR